VVPGPSWIDEVVTASGRATLRAATFAAEHGVTAWLRGALGLLPRPEQGLLLRKSFYDELGGHRAGASEPEVDLLRRIGRRRLVVLRTTVSKSDI
jgi:hypothetical protein